MPIEKLKFNSAPLNYVARDMTQWELTNVDVIVMEKINELIDFMNTVFTPEEIKLQEYPVCTYGRCECAHCKLLLKEYGNILEKYNSLLEENKKCQ